MLSWDLVLTQYGEPGPLNPYNPEATFIQKQNDPKDFENHLNPAMLVFIG